LSTRRYNPEDSHLLNSSDDDALSSVKAVIWALSIVYISMKFSTFRKLDLLPSSGKKGSIEILAVGPPG
jgi:hypothetical protein